MHGCTAFICCYDMHNKDALKNSRNRCNLNELFWDYCSGVREMVVVYGDRYILWGKLD